MMRPFSLLCMLLAIGSGLYLYRVKYRAQMLDREIYVTLKAADEVRAHAALLYADYQLLNDPIRLQELVDQYLPLKSTQPSQFTTLADLERRLPPIGIAPPEPAPEPEIPAAVMRPDPRAAEPKAAEPKPEGKSPEPRGPAEPRPAPAIAQAPRPAAPPPAAPPLAAPPPAAIAAAPPPQFAPPQFAPPPVRPAAPPSVIAAGQRAPTPLGLPGAATRVAAGAAIPSATELTVRSIAAPVQPASLPTSSGPTSSIRPPAAPPPRMAAPAAASLVGYPAADAVPQAPRSALGMARRSLGAQSQTSPSQTSPGGGTN